MVVVVASFLILSLCQGVFSTALVFITCTQSHIVLSASSSVDLRPRTHMHCQQPRKHAIYIEKKARCLNSSHPLLVDVLSVKDQSQSNDVIAVDCPNHHEGMVHEKVLPAHMDMLFHIETHGTIEVEILERNVMIVDARYAVPTLCQLIDDYDDLRITSLTDEGGCVHTSQMTPFSRELSDGGITYSARLNTSVLKDMLQPRLQCSIVACGEECLRNGFVCNPKRTSFSSRLIITKSIDASLLPSASPPKGQSDMEGCSCSWFWRSPVLIAVNVGLFMLSSAVWFIVIRTFLLNREEIIEILKHLLHLQGRDTRPRLDIIHPMDSFTTSPSLTSEKVSTIRLKLNQISTLGKKSGRAFTGSLRSNSPSSATGEHLSVQELHSSRIESTCFVSPSIMESLPDPPQLSVEQLPRLEMISRMREVQKSVTVDSMEVASGASPSEGSVKPSTPIDILPVPSPRAGNLSAKETPVLSSSGDSGDCLNSPPPQALASVTLSPSSSALRSKTVENSGYQPIVVNEECEFNSGITTVAVSGDKCEFRKRHRLKTK